MRITGGLYLNRPLTAPKGDAVRPATDKVRAAVFNILMHRFPESLENTQVLDLFCGAGTYGLEAVSRGAAACVFVDQSRASLAAARANAERLGCLPQCRFLQADARKLELGLGLGLGLEPLPTPPALVFLDPPYATTLLAETLPRLIDHLAPNAILVCEVPRHVALAVPDGTAAAVEKTYGDTKIVILIKC